MRRALLFRHCPQKILDTYLAVGGERRREKLEGVGGVGTKGLGGEARYHEPHLETQGGERFCIVGLSQKLQDAYQPTVPRLKMQDKKFIPPSSISFDPGDSTGSTGLGSSPEKGG